jgi:hypothetical protein
MESVDRFYRSYSKYLEYYDNDSLFMLFNSLHSLNDRLKSEYDLNLFEIEEFIVLKAIRNYIHHQGEMLNKLTSSTITKIQPIQTDLMFMCLIMKPDLEKAINEIPNKFRDEHKKVIENHVHFYGSVVNIGHVIFNMAAKLMVFLDKNSIEGKSDEYTKNFNCMVFDIENGHSITVSGRLYTHINNTTGKIEDILLRAIQT